MTGFCLGDGEHLRETESWAPAVPPGRHPHLSRTVLHWAGVPCRPSRTPLRKQACAQAVFNHTQLQINIVFLKRWILYLCLKVKFMYLCLFLFLSHCYCIILSCVYIRVKQFSTFSIFTTMPGRRTIIRPLVSVSDPDPVESGFFRRSGFRF